MVADNVDRLKRIVDDVLEAAPGAPTETRTLDACSAVQAVCTDWTRTMELEPGLDSRLRVELPAAPLAVSFDPEHLRRVLVNLLDNAGRYASATPGAIHVRLAERDDQTALLAVASDGAAIAADVERHLFEPFFSTRSRGTGLGLYICRELCERYGGSIDYWQHPATARHRNEFVVTLRVAAVGAAPPNQTSLLP
jgi:two-component system sensor histidine kinase PilS (NtrC family)